MRGCYECGALSGVDPLGICNACGKPATPQATLANAKPGRLMNNAGARAAEAELRIALAIAELEPLTEGWKMNSSERVQRALALLKGER